MFAVYWRDEKRNTYHGFIKARTHDEAYDFAHKKLRGCVITAIYRANSEQIEADDICLNFSNWKAYGAF